MKKIGILAGFSFFAGALFFALTFGFFQKTSQNETVLSIPIASAQTTQSDSTADQINHSSAMINFVPLVRKVKAAVVKVTSESILNNQQISGDDFFDRFFNVPRNKQRRVSGTGSGFLISKDGYIVTNNHVIDGALKIIISDITGKEYTAKKIGTDPKTDLALIKIEGNDFPFIEFGNSDQVEVGEWVLAIGNPLNQDLTVTSGIVSAKGRRLEGLSLDFQNFIQTDASINQGNSGGPLINMKGQAIGINSVILSTSGGSIGIGFAIPSTMAQKVISDLKKEGRVIRGYLGILFTSISEKDAKDFDLPQGGMIIQRVEKDTPAEKAGLQKMDLIIEINGDKIESTTDFQTKIATLNPGDKVKLTVLRDQKQKVVEVTVGEAPDSVKIQSTDDDGRVIDLGMVLKDNSRSLVDQFDLRTTEGVVVTDVEQDGVAAQHQLKPGDVILMINRTAITSVAQFRSVISKRSGSKVFLTINRNGEEYFIRFSIPE